MNRYVRLCVDGRNVDGLSSPWAFGDVTDRTRGIFLAVLRCAARRAGAFFCAVCIIGRGRLALRVRFFLAFGGSELLPRVVFGREFARAASMRAVAAICAGVRFFLRAFISWFYAFWLNLSTEIFPAFPWWRFYELGGVLAWGAWQRAIWLCPARTTRGLSRGGASSGEERARCEVPNTIASGSESNS